MHKQPLLRFRSDYSFKIGRWRFMPGLASTLMVLSVVPILLCLGYWQWQRFQYKTAPTHTQETRKSSLTLLQANILQKEGALQDLQGGYLQIEGQFLNQYAILVDNQSFKGQPGYKILTPLLLTGQASPTYVLIDRGWIPLGHSRARLPIIPPVEGTVHVKGRLYPPVRGFKLPGRPHPSPMSAEPTARVPHSEGGDLKHRHSKDSPIEKSAEHQWSLRVLDIDLKTLERALGHTLYPLILRLEPGDKLGFEILPFAMQVGIPPIKHLGYALQWFMMALAVLIYYGVINTSSIKKLSTKT
ncbi:MAG: SURF1 family protein [Gammaproteobacteria bacterium]|nr:SURF1 family protein [Gammaproteobacteria bacterium]